MASSILYPDEIVIASPTQALNLSIGHERGLTLAPRGTADYAYGTTALPFPDDLLIPESDWEGLIREKQERGTNLSAIMRRNKLPAKYQGRLPYCWIFAPTHGMEVVRMLSNMEYRSLSPASAGAYIKNFRAVGGWGKEALEYIGVNGLNLSSDWPDTSLDRRLATEENRALAMNNRATEWMELKRRSKKHWVSSVLRNIPVAAGYDEWEHEILIVDAVILNGVIVPRIRNQWKGFGDDNYAVLDDRWGQEPDDQVAPRVAVAA